MKLTLPCLLAFLYSASVTLAAEAPTASRGQSAPAPARVDDDTNAPPKTIGDHFTNSIDMELVKVGGFWAGKYEVTQKEYQKIMGGNPSAFPGPNLPVDSISWNDALEFCRKLTAEDVKKHKLPEGYSYSLPTEAQWEGYSAEATLSDSVTSLGGKRGGPAAVGSLGANSFGLYDTRGNVMEFCRGDGSQPYRVLRGGSWNDSIEVNLRKEFRFYCRPDERQNTFGFRCILLPCAAPSSHGS